MSEKFSLNWNDFQSKWNRSLSELRSDKDLADVTLISDDKVKFSAHKILLSSCSSMFKFILKENTNSNPMLYLGGVSSINLGFILDYIYHGEVNIFQEQLESFLENAQKLEIEGLIKGSNQDDPDNLNQEQNIYPEQIHEDQVYYNLIEEKKLARMDESAPISYTRQNSRASIHNVAKIDVGQITSDEIEKQVKDLYQKVEGVWRCLACVYTTRQISHMRMHVETHIDGLSYTCNLCNKEFR